MNLADALTMPTSRPPLPAAAPAPTSAPPTLGEVVARIGAEVAAPLTSALDRVMALASSGRIDRHGLQALRAEIDNARRVGLRGQQIARLASGAVRQSVERLDLPGCLREVLRGHALHGHGESIACPPQPTRAEVLADATLLHAVLSAAAEWSASLARATADWRIDVKPWPVRARVICRFAHVPPDRSAPQPGTAVAEASGNHHEESLDTLDWLLLTYACHIAGVVVGRRDTPTHSVLTLEFLNTVNGTLEGAGAVELASSGEGPLQTIAGCQVLVLAARRETRQRLRDATRGQDMQIDYVSTVAAAAQYCDDGAPQMLIYESALQGTAFEALRSRLADTGQRVALIEVLPEGQDCVMGTPDGDPVSRIGIEALTTMLLPMLLLDMGRNE